MSVVLRTHATGFCPYRLVDKSPVRGEFFSAAYTAPTDATATFEQQALADGIGSQWHGYLSTNKPWIHQTRSKF